MFSGNEWLILVVMMLVLVVPVLAVVAILTATSRRRSGAGAAPASVQSGAPAGWFADPSGRNEQRYWDGHGWTDAVVSNGQPGTDPL